jgi:hypothetical protein
MQNLAMMKTMKISLLALAKENLALNATWQ